MLDSGQRSRGGLGQPREGHRRQRYVPCAHSSSHSPQLYFGDRKEEEQPLVPDSAACRCLLPCSGAPQHRAWGMMATNLIGRLVACCSFGQDELAPLTLYGRLKQEVLCYIHRLLEFLPCAFLFFLVACLASRWLIDAAIAHAHSSSNKKARPTSTLEQTWSPRPASLSIASMCWKSWRRGAGVPPAAMRVE